MKPRFELNTIDRVHGQEGSIQAGGWFVLRRSPSLRYRPRGHEDPFFRAWLAFAAASPASVDAALSPGDDGSRPAAERIFALLSKKTAPGRCAKCHSVDASPDGALPCLLPPPNP